MLSDEPFGPFSVTPDSISRLGGEFTAFVNELLRAEAADADLAGGSLVTTALENVGDGGVDASLDSAVETSYLPLGMSAWQFKAGDLYPAKCAEELRGARHALEILRAGGKYRLVVGADINAKKVAGRRRTLEDEAAAQGIVVERDTIKVFNASDLAAWAAGYLSLAVWPLLGGITHAVVNFAAWADSSRLSETWVANNAAGAVATAVDKLVTGAGALDLHIEGVSGLGKTRSVLEALRGKPYEPLVAYVRAADDLPGGLVYQMQRQHRHAVLVIDECDAQRHEVLASEIHRGSTVRLITIGTPSDYRTREVQKIDPVDDEAVREILRLNKPALPPETARVVADTAAGNVGLALLLADDLARRPVPAVSGLITQEIIARYVARSLPAGRGLLACEALALFSSVGFDSDAADEIRAVGDGLGFDVLDLKAAAADLDRPGLLGRLGRFRAVTPHPLAVYLAARAWEQFDDQIVADLLPSLDHSMTVRLLQRATDIGEFAPVRRAVTQLLGPGGLFGNAGTAQDGRSGILTHLAMLAPQVIAGRLPATLAALTDQERSALASKRPEITWALEKLAWHRATFRQAADGLLSLAVLTEGLHQQAYDRTWTDLFGAILPTTSAAPDARIQYLADTARSSDRRARRLAVTAAARACSMSESVTVSAEVQGGFLVGARGMPATSGDVWEYCGAAMDILAGLANDNDPQVSDEAVSALVAEIHPCLENELLRERLAGAIVRLPAAGLTKARTELEHLRALFERTSGHRDTADRKAGLEALEARLPAASAEGTFDALANANRWDFRQQGALQQRLNDAAFAMSARDRIAHILKVIRTRPAAAFELGKTISAVADGDEDALDQLVAQAAAGNTEPLAGYLRDHVDKGAPSAFDDLLDSSQCAVLDDTARLDISVRGPQTARGWQRVERLVQGMPPLKGTAGLFGWVTDLSLQRLRELLSDWISRIGDQADYNAIVYFTGLALYELPPWQADIDPVVVELVGCRTRYPDVGNQQSAWTQLARRQLHQQPAELQETLFLLVDSGGYRPFRGSQEELLRETVERAGPDGWRKTMDRLAGSPRVPTAFRKWLAGAVDLAVAEDWVGTDLQRARLLAQVAVPGGDTADPVARFLLTNFGADGEVAAALGSAYVTGTFRGDYSANCQAQISQLTGWIDDPAEKQQVKIWAQNMITSLTAERDRALTKEAEYGL